MQTSTESTPQDSYKNICFPSYGDATISESEFNRKLRKSLNGIVLIYRAIYDAEGEIDSYAVCDALEPHLEELVRIESIYANALDFKTMDKAES